MTGVEELCASCSSLTLTEGLQNGIQNVSGSTDETIELDNGWNLSIYLVSPWFNDRRTVDRYQIPQRIIYTLQHKPSL